MPFPLDTLACTVDAAGISAPTYDEIYESLQASFKSIYGSDAYIAPDSQDGQMLAVFAKAISDCNNSAIAVYNNYSPTTARGAGLSIAVKMNGLRRRIASYSTADVLITGQANTIINGGIITDVNKTHQWLLPDSVTIPVEGEITVTATCGDLGAIDAPVDTLTQIVNPTLGWQSVSNTSEAVPGSPVETDAGLRRRQASASGVPARSALGAVFSGLADLVGVTEVAIHENYTDVTDSAGVPEHSIACIVVGGNVDDIASMVALKKSPGCNTFGDIPILTTDPNGLPITINFSRPTDVPVDIVLNQAPLAGYSTDIGLAQQASVTAFGDSMLIGQELDFNSIWPSALLVGEPGFGTYRLISMTANGGTANIPVDYNEQIVINSVTINLV